jgi:hypothetical protein
MKPFRKHVAIAVDGGDIKGVIGIAEAAEGKLEGWMVENKG